MKHVMRLALIALVAAAACGPSGGPMPAEDAAVLSGAALDGGMKSLADYKGKV
ncbi:MAG: hypothetical protein HYZ74_06320, partial [Elusimicrobia bacterium]|nr:hypothetical protein [Elusimicrobiota bacterium]